MLKDNKGVSLVTLVITIVIMLIMISIVINSSIKSVEETNLTKIENEIKNLEDAVNNRIVNHERNATLYPIVGEKIGDNIFEYIRSIESLDASEVSELVGKIADTYSKENEEYYRLVGKADAEKLGVEGLDAEHYYVVDYNECEVYGPISLELVNNGG